MSSSSTLIGSLEKCDCLKFREAHLSPANCSLDGEWIPDIRVPKKLEYYKNSFYRVSWRYLSLRGMSASAPSRFLRSCS